MLHEFRAVFRRETGDQALDCCLGELVANEASEEPDRLGVEFLTKLLSEFVSNALRPTCQGLKSAGFAVVSSSEDLGELAAESVEFSDRPLDLLP